MAAVVSTTLSPIPPPILDNIYAVYNTLPTLGAADDAFSLAQRQAVFAAVGALLSRFDNIFGLCLVQAHCTLAAGELMISKGNISQPEAASGAVCYPERWLSDGRPYEFASVPTEVPPADLIDEFKKLVGPFSGVLGLYYAGPDGKDKPSVLLERTEGRANIMEAVTPEQAKGQLETAWIPAREGFGPVTMACTIWCDTLVTRNETKHKGTKTHLVIGA